MADFIAEKIVQPAINLDQAAYCPTMDLIALSTIDGQIHVYRLNGQKVFGVSNEGEPKSVNQIQWKPNGQILAVALNGHNLILTNSHTGKKIHRIDCSKFSKSEITCVGWGVNFTEASILSERLQRSKDGVTLEDVISRNPSVKSIDMPPDLPTDLAFLDVEGSLPKLSPLLSGSIGDDVFSSRTSMDSIFETPTSKSTDSADVLVVGFEDGTIHLSIYDFFDIGTFSVSPASQTADTHKPIMHCSHPYSATHTLLVSSKGELKVVPIDLRMISSAGRYLPSLASKATQLQNMLRYLQQVHRQIHGDFKISQDLPRRFMGNIEDDLKATSDCTWEQAAYHLVVTGNCHQEVKEWLVDQLGERGYKRWDKAVTAGYESVQRLIHEHLLPALERFTVIVSRLRGLSRFQVSNAALGLSTGDLNNVLDTLSCLQLVAHHLLVIANTELQQFHAFSNWLRQEIDTQSNDASISDGLGNDPNIDHMQTLEYIQGAMLKSRLVSFLDFKTEAESMTQWTLIAEGLSLFDLYKRDMNPQNMKNSSKKLPGLKPLLDHLATLCGTVFDKIGETQRRNIRIATPISLGPGLSDKKDMRMIVEHPEKVEIVSLYIAVGPRPEHEDVQIYRIVLRNENGMSKTESFECALLRTNGWSVADFKFIDDKEIMLAMFNQTASCLFRLSYKPGSSGDWGLRYGKGGGSQESSYSVEFSDSEQASQFLWLKFPQGDSWVPERIEVNGRKGRRVVYVFARDMHHYRVYDLDGSGEVEEGERASSQSDTIMHD